MDLDVKHYIAFAQIRNVPPYNRVRAENRYLLIKECEKYLSQEVKRLGHRYRRTSAIKRFCHEYELPIRTFYRWYSSYKKQGILGLVPEYGKKRSPSVLKKQARRKRLDSSTKTVKKTIEIDVLNPLACLEQIDLIVQHDPAFSSLVKESMSHLVDELHIAKDGGNGILLPRKLTDEEKEKLNKYINGTHKNHRAKALGLLMMDADYSLQEIIFKTQRARRTIYRWLKCFEKDGLVFIETKPTSKKKEERKRQRKIRVIDILHSPPSAFGVNRSNWVYDAIIKVYRDQYGENLPVHALQAILREEHYSWKRARTMLTSKDPFYREKVQNILNVLHGLTPADVFFFIDEAGPWRVKKYGGQVLSPPGKTEIIPDDQPDKGAVFMIAALEAQTNQVIWQFIKGKSATVIVRLLDELLDKYRAYARLCLTWDALSSHSSKKVNDWIGSSNFRAEREGYPRIEVHPLPSNAQFLNVVESTFRNIRKAVIYNSDYQSVEEMQQAISRYLDERNAYFKANPRRAGNKIWDKELFTPEDLPGGLFRRM